MKRIISFILISSMLITVTAYASEKTSATDIDISEYVNNEIFVMYKDCSFEVLEFEDSQALTEMVKSLSVDEDVFLVQPNYSYSPSELISSDPLVDRQWGLNNDGTFYMEDLKNEYPVYDTPFGDKRMPGHWRTPDNFGRPGGYYRNNNSYSSNQTVNAVSGIDINLSDARNKYNDSGKEVIVALIDTGVDFSHEELAGRIWTNDDEIAENGIDDDNNGYIDDVYGWNFYYNNANMFNGSEDDHGTHGAGTIVAKANNQKGIAGIAQSDNIKVMSVKALGGQNGYGSTASVIQAIQYAEKNGAVICNLSLGTTSNDRALYNTIANSNMLFVTAAGNDGTNTDYIPCYPASYDLENIISVANLNYDGTLNYSSNYGKNSVDIAAPGSYILSTSTYNNYSYMSGTSMSAPMVSGAAALIYSHFGSISLADVKEIILSSAAPLENLSNSVSSGGMLDLGNALSFDTNNLSDNQWPVKTPVEYKGSAPVISAYSSGYLNSSYITIQVTDEDNDLEYISYASGELTADYFNNGNEETPIKLTYNNTFYFESDEGTYTFYAADSKGNETVYCIKIQKRQQQIEEPRRYPRRNFYEEFLRYLFSNFYW